MPSIYGLKIYALLTACTLHASSFEMTSSLLQSAKMYSIRLDLRPLYEMTANIHETVVLNEVMKFASWSFMVVGS